MVTAGESNSGSGWLFAAERGHLVRALFFDECEALEPFDEGHWLTGAGFALDDFDMFDALKLAGFDYTGADDAQRNWIFEVPDALDLPEGALTERLRRRRTAATSPSRVRHISETR